MANIPIEKKSGTGFLLPLLALLGLLVLGFFLLRGCNDQDTVATGTDTTAATAPAAAGTTADTVGTGMAPGAGAAPGAGVTPGTGVAAGDTLRRIEDFAVSDLRPYVGRTVRLENVTPVNVIGDSTFTIQGANNRNMLVVLQRLGEGERGTADGAYTVRAGQTLNVLGTVESYPPADTLVLSAEDRAAARAQGIYIRARRVGGPDVVRN